MVSLLFTVRLSEPTDAANILINYNPLDRGPLGQGKENMYERLLFHAAERIQSCPLPKDKLTYYTEEEKEQHQKLQWPGFGNTWLAEFRANSNLIIFKNPINRPSYKGRLDAEEWQLLKSSLSFELKFTFLVFHAL